MGVEVSETLCSRFCEICGLENWDLGSSSSGCLEPDALVDDVQDISHFSDVLDCSDSTDIVEMFKDSSFFINNLSFFSALFLNFVSSLSWFSSSINLIPKHISEKSQRKTAVIQMVFKSF